MKAKAKNAKRLKLPNLGELLTEVQTGLAAGERCTKGVLQLRMTSITEHGRINLEGAVRIPDRDAGGKHYLLKEGDILFGNTNSAELVGRAGLFSGHTEQITFSNHLTRLRVDRDKIDPAWLTEWILWLWREGKLRRITTRFVGQSSIATAALLSLIVPLRDLRDQSTQASLLDTIDDDIESTRQLAEQTRRLKDALAQDLLVHAVLKKRFPIRTARLGQLFTERTEPGRAGLPTMSVTMNDGIVDREDMDRRVESELTPQEHLLARKGDIAYNMMRMWQGVSGLIPHDSLVSPAYVVVTPTKEIDAAFAAHLFKLPEIIRLLRRYSQGLTEDRLRLYYHQFAEIQVSIPKDKTQQQRIAHLLTTLADTADSHEARLEALVRTKTAISNKIFRHD